MTAFSVAEAKNNLSELIDRAIKGEDVTITRHGTPVAEIRAVHPAPRPMTQADLEWLEKRRVKMRPGLETPSDSVAAIRDEDEH